MRFESVEWRKTFLWTLEVDDLLKANLDTLQRLFQSVKRGTAKYITYKNLLDFLAGFPL